MRGAAFHRPLRLLSRQEPVNQTGSERIASSDTVENFKVLAVSCLVELAIAITNRAPVIQSRGLSFPERGSNNLERIVLHDLCNHLLEAFHFECRMMLVHPRNLVAQRGRKVLLIAEHDVDVRRDTPIYLLRLFFPAMSLPERGTVIQVVRNNRAVTPRRLHRSQRDFRSRRRKRAEDAASMKPARALFSKNLIPIDIARLQLGDRGVPAVVTP